MGLTIAGAALLITGLSMVLVGEVLRLKSGHGGPGIARTGEFFVFSGLGIGVALLVALTVGQADRGGRAGRRRVARARSGPPRDAAEEWLSPLQTAGPRLVPQRVPPSWPKPVEENGPGATGYADDGWHPDMDDGWSPGPAYVWNPPQEDDWDRGADQDWIPAGDEDWNPAGPTGITGWPPDDPRRPDGNGQEPSPRTGPQRGYVTGPHGYPNAPGPGGVSGPQPAYGAGPELEHVSDRYLAGPEAGHVSDPYLAGPEARQVSDPALVYVSDQDADQVAGPETGYLDFPPAPRPATASWFASEPGTTHPGAPDSFVSDLDTVREDDDTSPIPVVRGRGQPASEPRQGEAGPGASSPRASAESFSVWEPAPKPNPERGRGSASDEVYRPAHAEPPPAETQEKIEQIKDLYLTAEAIGEDALSKHFDQMRQRQRSLISEFFEKAGLGSKGTPSPLRDDSAEDGASLPG